MNSPALSYDTVHSRIVRNNEPLRFPRLNPAYDFPHYNPNPNPNDEDDVETLRRMVREKSMIIEEMQKHINSLESEVYNLRQVCDHHGIILKSYDKALNDMEKNANEYQSMHIRDRVDVNRANYEKIISEIETKGMQENYDKLLRDMETMSKKSANLKAENENLKRQVYIYERIEDDENDKTYEKQLRKMKVSNRKLTDNSEYYKTQFTNLKKTNKQLLTDMKEANKTINNQMATINKQNITIKTLETKISSFSKDYQSTSFFEWLTDPLLSKIEVKRQTKKNEELTKNIDMNTELYKSIFGKFDSYKKNISAWIDNNFKSYCNYINTIANVSEYNNDVIEDLLKLIDEIENWVIDLIVEYEKKLKTKKTKTTIKSEVEDEIDDKKIGKKTKARKIPEKPELIDPPLPDNLTDAEKLLNAPKESEKRAEPSN